MFIVVDVLRNINNTDTKIALCDVGQGDGPYIRIKNTVDIVVDAGPDGKILSCLSRHMPFMIEKLKPRSLAIRKKIITIVLFPF